MVDRPDDDDAPSPGIVVAIFLGIVGLAIVACILLLHLLGGPVE